MAYDLIVIGSGPGGYVCAVRAAQLGLKTAIVEKEKTLGGTCLNIGCIPSKALLQASEHFHEVGHGMAAFGVIVDPPKLDHKALMKHKDDVVSANVNGVAFLMKKNKVDVHQGLGAITGKGQVTVTAAGGETKVLETKSIVIATGSESAMLPGVVVDEKQVVTSTGALSLEKVPGKLLVIGAGVIGLELGSAWGRLGAKVEVVEFLDRILPGMDGEVAKQMQRTLEKQGFTFNLSSKVTKAETGKIGVETSYQPGAGGFLLPQDSSGRDGVKVTFEPVAGGEAKTIEADVVLVATGRRPNTAGLNLDAMKIATERGRVIIDGHFRTNIEAVYAIGDVVRGPMLAHKAEDEGVAVAELIAGKAGHVNYDVIPAVVYTQPEVASVGKTEEELKEAGVAYVVGKFPFTANGRARAMRHTDGFVKFLADAKTDRVLGAHIVGFGAGEMIHEIAVLMEFGGSSEDLARTCHAHPTMSEAVKEAAMGVEKRSIHI
ncbi:dihydrolipoyl dehydrogenase family protein [Terrarubrum flagellatum]|uniref:dihydrolipoyl dehydrogenase family protein n=1 Tax=Terrirubrum flagellatum TaxID=2895980 RepID=UPI0031456A3E